ncbi:hypothetical protein CAPTEDRAFT_204287 [Capitella teleta]|uniref:Uncharacterized protein n=1 Tax=Capitella teleta TaxID=283909 RepID=R7UDV6_CAPTE|nr:hypothetical protein CAPTEDRAFT_204287 [Capitella teleta]|eukprot:ELU01948.1 hypothetical protein CAPTEDRAFT_204287 [Capitella teleta]
MPQDSSCKELNAQRRASSCASERRGSLEARAILGHWGFRRQSAGDAMISPELPPIRPNSRKSSKSSSTGQNQCLRTPFHIVLDQRATNPGSTGHSSMESLTCGPHAQRTDSHQSADSTTATRRFGNRKMSCTSVKGSSSIKKTPASTSNGLTLGQTSVNRRHTGLQRNQSEKTLTSLNQRPEARRRQETGATVNRPLTKTASQPQLINANKASEDSLNERNLRRLQSCEWLGDDSAEDEEDDEGNGPTKQRIIKWLIGVEGNAERPQSPLPVVDEGPAQTDTAIHIVYEEQ